MSVWQSVKNFWYGTAPQEPQAGNQSPLGSNRMALDGARRRAISFDTAMTVSAVYACIRLTAETIASLPFSMYTLGADGSRVINRDHELSKLLRHRPNRRQTRVEFWQQVILNLCASGNAYVIKGRIGSRLVSLTPINSAGVTVQLQTDQTLKYIAWDANNQQIEYQSADVWHIRLIGNGLIGLSPIAMASQAIGVALDSGNKVADILSNGAKPSGILSVPTWPNAEQREGLRNEMSGLINGAQTEIPVLGGGMKFEKISLSPADIELLETRRFTLEEIARIFGVPSVLINDTSASTVWGSGIQSLIEGYYKFNLRPYLEAIECSIVVNLLTAAEWDLYEFEFAADALLRASTRDRIEANARQIVSGQATPNEIRISEGREPLTGGDSLLVPVNMIQIEKLGSVIPANSKNEVPL